jgi:DNA-directed RNA polymerase subunit M/transcription elongation factor TFIIS
MVKNTIFNEYFKNNVCSYKAYLSEYRRRMDQDRNTQGYNVLIVDWAPLADPKLSGNANFLLMYTFGMFKCYNRLLFTILLALSITYKFTTFYSCQECSSCWKTCGRDGCVLERKWRNGKL